MDQTPSGTEEVVGVKDRLDQTTFHLDSVQMKAFCRALDAPVFETESNPGLERLLTITPPWSSKFK